MVRQPPSKLARVLGVMRSALRFTAALPHRPQAMAQRGTVRGVPYLSVTLDVPLGVYVEVARAVAGGVAEVCARHQGSIGSVTVVAGEEPAMVSLAPHRDTVARRVYSVLLAGESHRFPHLVLLLAPRVYLAQVVDPYALMEATLDVIAQLLLPYRVILASRLTVQPRRHAVAVEIVSMALERQRLRRALGVACGAALPARLSRRASGAPAAARPALNRRLQA